jgi:hypothetical protein
MVGDEAEQVGGGVNQVEGNEHEEQQQSHPPYPPAADGTSDQIAQNFSQHRRVSLVLQS